MAATSDGDLSDFSESSEPVNSPVNSLWLSQNSQTILMIFGSLLKGLAHAKIIKKSVILFRVLNMTIWCKHVHRLEL